jgi:threonine aldolase
MLGAGMRQCGIIAAPGIYALTHNIERLKEDAENAKFLAAGLRGLKLAKVQKDVQTNIVMIDISPSGLDAKQYAEELRKEGLLAHPVPEKEIRLVFYKGVGRSDAGKAVEIIKKVDERLSAASVGRV